MQTNSKSSLNGSKTMEAEGIRRKWGKPFKRQAWAMPSRQHPNSSVCTIVSTEWDCLKLKGFYTAKGRIRVKDTAPRMVKNS